MASRVSAIVQHLHPLVEEKNRMSSKTSAKWPNGMLADQVAIITGSGQGIGQAAAKLFAKEGAAVVVTDIDAKKSDAVAKDIIDTGGKALSVPGDVTDPGFPDKIVKATLETFGKINHIVNNAGYTFDGMIHKLTDKQWDLMIAVHNTAPFRLIRAAADQFRNNSDEPKTIVMVSSTSGIHGNIGQANYASAKMGVLGFAKTVCKEWGQFGVRCNAIAFGWIDTRLTRAKELGEAMIVDGQKISLGIPIGNSPLSPAQKAAGVPLRRPGTAEEAASGILFLCSPLSTYVSGHCLELTGGVGI